MGLPFRGSHENVYIFFVPGHPLHTNACLEPSMLRETALAVDSFQSP